jgi:signal peptidase I
LSELFFLKKVKGISMHPKFDNDSFIVGVTSEYEKYVSRYIEASGINLFKLSYEINDVVLIEKNYGKENKYINRFFLKRVHFKSGDTLFYDHNKSIIADSSSINRENTYSFVIPGHSDNFYFSAEIEKLDSLLNLNMGDFIIQDSVKNNFVVSDNLYFVLGDNLKFSSDSRDWGFVPEKAIAGKVLFNFKF